MIKVEGLFALVTFALWVYCLVNVIQTPESAMRNLPKMWWLLLVLFFPFVGSIAYLVAGQPESGGPRRSAYERATPAYPEYDRPGRMAATSPDDDDAFLRQVRERAEMQRKAYEEKKKREAGGSAPESAPEG